MLPRSRPIAGDWWSTPCSIRDVFVTPDSGRGDASINGGTKCGLHHLLSAEQRRELQLARLTGVGMDIGESLIGAYMRQVRRCHTVAFNNPPDRISHRTLEYLSHAAAAILTV